MEYWDKRIQSCISELEADVDILDAIPDQNLVREKLGECERKLQQIQTTRGSYQADMRILSDQTEALHYKTALRRYDERVAAAKTKINNCRSEMERKQLLSGASQAKHGHMDNNDQLLDKIDAKLDDIEDAYKRGEVYLEEIKQVGGATVERLVEQRQQLGAIHEKTDEIEDQLKRADKLIRTFARRMATDRLIQVFAFINVSLMIAVIIYAIVTKANLQKGITNSSNLPNPSNM